MILLLVNDPSFDDHNQHNRNGTWNLQQNIVVDSIYITFYDQEQLFYSIHSPIKWSLWNIASLLFDLSSSLNVSLHPKSKRSLSFAAIGG